MDLQEMTEKIEKISELGKDDVQFYSAHDQPFRVYGLLYMDGKYRRLPEAVAKTGHETVLEHHACTVRTATAIPSPPTTFLWKRYRFFATANTI